MCHRSEMELLHQEETERAKRRLQQHYQELLTQVCCYSMHAYIYTHSYIHTYTYIQHTHIYIHPLSLDVKQVTAEKNVATEKLRRVQEEAKVRRRRWQSRTGMDDGIDCLHSILHSFIVPDTQMCIYPQLPPPSFDMHTRACLHARIHAYIHIISSPP